MELYCNICLKHLNAVKIGFDTIVLLCDWLKLKILKHWVNLSHTSLLRYISIRRQVLQGCYFYKFL